jgi:hypothetical protein
MLNNSGVIMECEKHEGLERAVQSMHSDVKEIKAALLGDFDREGLVARVRRNEELAEAVKGVFWKFIAASIGGAGVVVGVVKAITTVLD